MNERIRELADQAEDYATAEYEKWIPTPDFSGIPHVRKIFNEKFAQLIIRECSKVIVNGGYWSGGPLGPKRQCTPPEIANMITEHFGVEE